MEQEILQDAIKLVEESTYAYCHYITPNDVGETGGHQCGFHVPKHCYGMFFDSPGKKGENKDCNIVITWQKDFSTDSRAIYYGVRTRNEYRLTRFGRGFEFLQDKYVGSLLIMTKNTDGEYNAYVLANQDNIEDFMAIFNLDVSVSNHLIKGNVYEVPEDYIAKEFDIFIKNHASFPDTIEMANFARESIIKANKYSESAIVKYADQVILKWVAAEYRLFGGLEEKIYKPIYSQPFQNCQSLIDFSNSILNRRKSRAGKSLEHHLAYIFTCAGLKFEEQVVTEGNKKPDFIFPDGNSYHDFLFPADKLTMLGSKTTCKDRWRQVLNEANRIDNKHLFTLQQGVSKNQLEEMKAEHLTLVVPKSNISLFHPEFHDCIMDLESFIKMVNEKQSDYSKFYNIQL